MAEGDILIFNRFKADLPRAVHNLDSAGHTIQVTIHNGLTVNIDTQALWADVSATEYSTAAGYTAGGKTLANQSVTQDNTNDRALLDADNLTWTALGPLTPSTPSHFVMWNTTPTSPLDPLICTIEIATDPNGADFTLSFSTSPSAYISIT